MGVLWGVYFVLSIVIFGYLSTQSIWILIIGLILLLAVTKDLNILKFLLVMLFLFFIHWCFLSGPKKDDLERQLLASKANLTELQSQRGKVQNDLKDAKEAQGWFRNIFWDSDKVNRLQEKIVVLDKALENSHNNIQKIENKLGL